jgi:cell division protease FtsH
MAYIAIAIALIIAIMVIFPKLLSNGEKVEYSEVVKNFDDYKVNSYTLDLGTGELVYTLKGDDKKYTYEVPNVSIFLNDVDSEESNYRVEYNKRNPDEPLKQDYKKIKDTSWLISVVPTIIMLALGISLFVFMMKQTGSRIVQRSLLMHFLASVLPEISAVLSRPESKRSTFVMKPDAGYAALILLQESIRIRARLWELL